MSDILSNCSAPIPNAWSYRSLFQSSLPTIFVSFHRAHTHPTIGRLSANALKEKVQNVIQAWNRWAIFPQALIDQLKEIFDQGDQAMHATKGTPLQTSSASSTEPQPLTI